MDFETNSKRIYFVQCYDELDELFKPSHPKKVNPEHPRRSSWTNGKIVLFAATAIAAIGLKLAYSQGPLAKASDLFCQMPLDSTSRSVVPIVNTYPAKSHIANLQCFLVKKPSAQANKISLPVNDAFSAITTPSDAVPFRNFTPNFTLLSTIGERNVSNLSSMASRFFLSLTDASGRFQELVSNAEQSADEQIDDLATKATQVTLLSYVVSLIACSSLGQDIKDELELLFYP